MCKHAPADTVVSYLLPFAVNSVTFVEIVLYLFKNNQKHVQNMYMYNHVHNM